MKTEKIKDVIKARWKFISNNAALISDIAREMAEAEEINKEALEHIRGYEGDNNVTLESLEQMLDALGDAAKPFT